MIVVTVDASYTNPCVTNVVVPGPGQTANVLLTANQPLALYCGAAHPYASIVGVSFDNTATAELLPRVYLHAFDAQYPNSP